MLSRAFGPNHLQEDAVDKDQRGQTKGTEEQKHKVKPATERDAETVELGVEELEERIAPMKAY
jgi:uncharacterized small protein (DUF1192 family)